MQMQILYEWNRVHDQIGTSREIIFRIDEDSLELDSLYYSFTKTYRIPILYFKLAKTYKKLLTDISNLIFYGQVLGRVDFVYIYFLFDFYEI